MDPDYPGAQGKPKTEVSNTELKQQLKEQYQEKKAVARTARPKNGFKACLIKISLFYSFSR